MFFNFINKLAKKTLSKKVRRAEIIYKTKETNIRGALVLDGTGDAQIETGIGFFDHMLQLFAYHAGCDLQIYAEGDLEVDEHHTVEDCALALGKAFKEALGDKRGIERYGFMLPMDESLAEVALDFSGRPTLVWNVDFKREYVGKMPTEMFVHFFKSFVDTVGCTLHVKAYGENEHHKIEAVFKAFGRSVRMAIKQNDSNEVPSSKGVL